MSSKKTKRAGKPDAEKRATHSPAEQVLDIAVQSRRPNQITYPFDSPHILEKQVIPWLCSVVYSGEYLAGGNKRSGALKRVRSRIRYARSIEALAPAKRHSVEAAPFFEWAVRQKDWKELTTFEVLQRGCCLRRRNASRSQSRPINACLPSSRYVRRASRRILISYTRTSKSRARNRTFSGEEQRLIGAAGH